MNDASNGNPGSARQLVPVAEGLPAVKDPYGRSLDLYGRYGASDGFEGEESNFNIFEYLLVLNKYKWLILTIALAFVFLGSIKTLTKTPLYASQVRVTIDRVANVVGGPDTSPGYSDYEFMQTQFEILQSRTMAERVVSALNLGQDEDFLKSEESFSIVQSVKGLVSNRASDKRRSEKDRAERAINIVLGNRRVQPVTNTRLVAVKYTDTDPGRAQRIANAYADAYVSTNIDKRFQANDSAKVFLEDKIAQMKQRVEESETTLVEFAQEQQIVAVDVDDKTSVGESNLAAANAELATLSSERIKNENLWRQAEQADSINVPQLLQDSALQTLLTKRTELKIEYEQKRKTFKPAYPAMVDLRAQLDEIKRQIGYQLKSLKQSLKASYESLLAREEAQKARVVELKKELLELQKGSIKFNMVKRDVDLNRDLYTSLLKRYKQVDVASGVGTNSVFVVDKASPGRLPAGSLLKSLLQSLLVGLAFGVVAAFALEYFNDKVDSAEDAEKITGLPVLGIIPKVKDVEGELADPRSILSESYRSLCTALQFATEDGVPKTLTITSAGPAEGKSLTALSIAKHFANLGRKVLLVDADLRNPSQHIKLALDNSIGLSNCLTGACTPPEAIQKTEVPTLAFLASGPLPPNAADVLGGARLVSLLSVGLEVFDLIIIDGPPVLEIADAQLLSSVASGTLFVVGAGKVRKKFIRGAIKRLQLVGTRVIGAALTQHDSKVTGYGYGYGYGYGQEAAPAGLYIDTPSEQQAQLAYKS
jgi:succinoglycan biosynthesis transport protein ExoP